MRIEASRMKVLCDREKLREGLAVVNSVVPTKTTKAVLSNVCLVATEDALELVGTDLDVAVRYRIAGDEDVKVSEPGTVVVPARVTLDFVRDLTGETVTLDAGESRCVLSGGEDSCELVLADPDEFPVVARFDEAGSCSIQAGTFTALVERTVFAAAREQGRYAMHGVLTEIEEHQLRLVATDGRRLAVASAPMEASSVPERPVIVPTKGMQLFCRVIRDPLEQVRLAFTESQVGFKTQQAEVFARLIDGEFPRYSAVIPRESGHRIEADAELFARKLRLVANVTGDEARAVRLTFQDGRMELFGQSAGRGEAHAHMEVDYDGESAEIAFNPDYVLDGIKNCEGGRVHLEFNERTSPGKFQLGENYVYVVMPITIDA
jgi:DNA polymerase-3 subunit beta